MSPRDYGEYLARLAPPISDEQAMEAARILASAPHAEQGRVA